MSVSARPLDGMRVIEITHVAAGPFTGMLLADLGADVVKVEPPTGDQMRQWPPVEQDETGDRYSHNFASINRNKRSIAADLKDAQDLALIRDLIAKADVVVENYRPGVLDRLGLGYDTVTADHPGLIYCSISGFGLTSPYVDRGAYDVVIQGMSGLMSVTGTPDGEPVKSGVPMGDFVAGLYAALTISALYPKVKGSGQSVRLDCPMLDCLIATSALQTSEYWGTGKTPAKLGSAHPRNAPYRAFEAADGYFTLAAGNDRLWHDVCRVVGREDLIDDARFQDQTSRAQHQEDLLEILAPIFSTRTVDAWLSDFADRGVPCGPVYSFSEVLADDHVTQTGLVQDMPVPVIGSTKTVVYPVRIEGLSARLDLSPPVLGANRDDVLADWGSHE